MKSSHLLPVLIVLLTACSSIKSTFELSPNQSMLITGKGKGQDAAYNPYKDSGSVAVVKNLGEDDISVRIQENGELIGTTPVKPGTSEDFTLNQGYELYLDTEEAGKAKVKFQRQ